MELQTQALAWKQFSVVMSTGITSIWGPASIVLMPVQMMVCVGGGGVWGKKTGHGEQRVGEKENDIRYCCYSVKKSVKYDTWLWPFKTMKNPRLASACWVSNQVPFNCGLAMIILYIMDRIFDSVCSWLNHFVQGHPFAFFPLNMTPVHLFSILFCLLFLRGVTVVISLLTLLTYF
jgi:hypothetical protein